MEAFLTGSGGVRRGSEILFVHIARVTGRKESAVTRMRRVFGESLIKEPFTKARAQRGAATRVSAGSGAHSFPDPAWPWREPEPRSDPVRERKRGAGASAVRPSGDPQRP